MELKGYLATELLWGYGSVPEFLTLCRYEPVDADEHSCSFLFRVRPVDDPFVKAADLRVTVNHVEEDDLLLALNGCEHLRVINTRKGPDLRLSNYVKWWVDVRAVTAADQMEMMLIVDDLDGWTGYHDS